MPERTQRFEMIKAVSENEPLVEKGVRLLIRRDRIVMTAEVVRQDVTIEDGKISGFRVRLGVSFKYERE